ncbi:flagellar biosynthetic protein FliO [Salinicola aestuarinus]|uniref:flagellar biosynthetic protein FliO n=1 Tax=Salinicola aestuarinus TaxID=1949082 RepID=UPI001CB72435|nr:flagellar biosynthetic protein FliO [Salinicola aestuarinus]
MNDDIPSTGIGSGGEAMSLMALGKTALSLAVVVGIILLCAWLLKRVGPNRRAGSQHLRVVASTPVGQRERVVIVEVEDRWLVLGVGGGQVTRLDSMDPPAIPPGGASDDPALSGSFSQRLRQAMKHNLTPAARRSPVDDAERRPTTPTSRPDEKSS